MLKYFYKIWTTFVDFVTLGCGFKTFYKKNFELILTFDFLVFAFFGGKLTIVGGFAKFPWKASNIRIIGI